MYISTHGGMPRAPSVAAQYAATVPSTAAEPGSIMVLVSMAAALLCALQEVFMTTAGTLLSARHENVTDSSGALFIDSEEWGGTVVVCVCAHACMRVCVLEVVGKEGGSKRNRGEGKRGIEQWK